MFRDENRIFFKKNRISCLKRENPYTNLQNATDLNIGSNLKQFILANFCQKRGNPLKIGRFLSLNVGVCALCAVCWSVDCDCDISWSYSLNKTRFKTSGLFVDFMFIVTLFVGVCNCSMFCCTLLYVHSSIAIILMGKRDDCFA